MSDPLSIQLEAIAHDQEIAENRKAERQSTEERTAAAQLVNRYSALLGNPNLVWWLETILRPKVKLEHDAALDPKNGKDGCWDHIQRHAIAKEMADSLEIGGDEAVARLDQILAAEKAEV